MERALVRDFEMERRKFFPQQRLDLARFQIKPTFRAGYGGLRMIFS
jgi:hypothetical protein